jgi:hypothetical protein
MRAFARVLSASKSGYSAESIGFSISPRIFEPNPSILGESLTHRPPFLLPDRVDPCRTDCYFDVSGRMDLDLKAVPSSENYITETEISWPKEKP